MNLYFLNSRHYDNISNSPSYIKPILLKYDTLNMYYSKFNLIVISILIQLFLLGFTIPISVAQDTIEINPKVGKVIDSFEKATAGIMPYFSKNIFLSGSFILTPDSIIVFEANLKNDSTAKRIISKKEFEWIQNMINKENYDIDNFSYTDTSAKKIRGWINLGIGGSNIGPTFGASYTHFLSNQLITLRSIYNKEIDGFFKHITPLETAHELGVLYGLSVRNKRLFATLSAGIGSVWGIKRGNLLSSRGWLFSIKDYETINYFNLSMPVEIQLVFLSKSNHLGIGLNFFGNVNLKIPFSGINLNFYVTH